MQNDTAVATAVRNEVDSLGEVEVPATAYYGAQTTRAAANFTVSGIPISRYPELIQSLATIKLAAARANRRLGDLTEEKFIAISAACDAVIRGELTDQFPLDVFQGGAGTSTNMNVNEVIANRALEHLGLPKGRYDAIHPNNDVNLSQSTNDVYPSAVRLALLSGQERLSMAVERLAAAFETKGVEFASVVKLGRTQLQDAVPMTLGQEFHAFGVTLREDVLRLGEAAQLLHELNLGGTAVGTGITADPLYASMVIDELALLTGRPLKAAQNLIEACWDTGAFVSFSGTVKRTAVKLSKIANDLRLLSSGPRGGFGEINLPPRQPGSSIMPGKVNPVIPELVNQVAFYVIGADLTVTMAAEAGQLQLNAMEPVIAFSLLQSLSLLSGAVDALTDSCVVGITANELTCRSHLEAGTALATALIGMIGYERSAYLAKQILATGRTMRELLVEEEGISADLVEKVLDVEALTKPSRLRYESLRP